MISRAVSPRSVPLPALLVVALFGAAALQSCGSSQRVTVGGHPPELDSLPRPVFSSGRSPGHPDASQRSFLDGSILEMQQRYREAIASYEHAIALDSSAGPAYFAIAKCYSKLHLGDSALTYARRAVRIDSNRADVRKMLASLLLSEGRFMPALEQFEGVLRLTPNDVEARYLAAQLWQRVDSDRAIVHMEYIRQNFPEDPDLLLTLGEIYLNRKRFDDAAGVFRQLIRVDNGSSDIYRILEQALLRGERYDDALRLVEDLRGQQRGDSLASELLRNQLGNALDMLTNNDAGPSFRAYAGQLAEVGSDGGDHRSLLLGGLVRMELADTLAADSLVERALADSLARSDDWSRAARTYLGLGRNDAAIRLLTPSYARFASDSEVPFLLGLAHWGAGMESSAEQYIRRSLSLNDDNAWAWSALAQIYDHSGRYKAGDAAYQRAIDLAPQDPMHLNNYAFALADRSARLDTALALAERALDAEPENEIFLDTVGWIYFKLKDYERALHYIRRSVDIGGADADVIEHLGDVYSALGQKKLALDEYRRALKLKPASASLQGKLRAAR